MVNWYPAKADIRFFQLLLFGTVGGRCSVTPEVSLRLPNASF